MDRTTEPAAPSQSLAATEPVAATPMPVVPGAPSSAPANRVLVQMLERLFASMVNGPAMNARPHSSRQRIDLTQLAKLQDVAPAVVLRNLLSGEGEAEIIGKTPLPKKGKARLTRNSGKNAPADEQDPELTDEDRAQMRAWSDQQATITKLRTIVEDAKTYEQDTGVAVLNVGFPMLSLPPGSFGGKQGPATRRILAPVALIPVAITVKSSTSLSVKIVCRGDGTDLVRPNDSLLAWIQQNTGVPNTGVSPLDIFSDEEGENPWREICELVRHVCRAIRIEVPPLFNAVQLPAEIELAASPRADDEDAKPAVHLSAIAGLYPLANQGLLRDMQAMSGGEQVTGPIRSFIYRAEALTDAAPVAGARNFADERLVTQADPCQARSVKLARQCKALVIHGPPGTGKSQTITNIIGDHLARGQRVLFVCDKRTALDVVQNRLQRLGLGSLCAVIHDPQRDQRELYRSIREQLENLADVKTAARAEKELAKIDAELQLLHGELTSYHAGLSSISGDDAKTFHDLVGEWFAIDTAAVQFDPATTGALTLKEVDAAAAGVKEMLRRALVANYAQNPWRTAAGVTLAGFLARAMDSCRSSLAMCVEAAESADATRDPAIAPLLPDAPLAEQAKSRAALADALGKAVAGGSPEVLRLWAAKSDAEVNTAVAHLAEGAKYVEVVKAGPLETELSLVDRDKLPTLSQIIERQNALGNYLAIAGAWHAFLQFGKKKAARVVLAGYGQVLSPQNAQRVFTYLTGLRARILLTEQLRKLGHAGSAAMLDDATISKSFTDHDTAVRLRAMALNDRNLAPVYTSLLATMADSATATGLIDALQKATPRCQSLEKLESAWQSTALLDANWLLAAQAEHRAGREASPRALSLASELPTLEDMLRIRATLAELPPTLQAAAVTLLKQPIESTEGVEALRKAALANEITRRLATDPQLQAVDGKRMAHNFERYRELAGDKMQAVVDLVLRDWTTRQKDRLLAASGERMNSTGADLKRRLTLRGERAMRLRQVIAVGRAIDGGDPLFDLRPVWMASPETVAQLFDRAPVFDVVVFDEASQCRLEEALPVLTRGQRVVIAGDPKQLPPTRFFESAVATSEDDELDTDQALFEAQQSDVEDLLAAALGLDIQQSYLDVHYRSRNADLIGFSNEQFYGSRLQAIPGHPSNRAKVPPLSLVRVEGIYEDRQNEAEATKIIEIVKTLLDQAKPPSIGIACFNLVQRDLIIEKLDEAAEEDAPFARRLAEARTRIGSGSFEGLFVKNLENVQGDERDHLIISTTYGPDPKGKFRQNFGPLGKSGGGRRLNVLVTRARDRVHLVTSIPPSAYKALPPVPNGQQPTGAYLLYLYLAYAERLERIYDEEAAEEAAQQPAQPETQTGHTRTPSVFVEALAERLKTRHHTGTQVYWGNDGIGIDLALAHPARPGEVTTGVLCDITRFAGTDDPVEWDIFRTGIHENQGWKLTRIWTPHFYRDEQGVIARVLQDAQQQIERPTDTQG